MTFSSFLFSGNAEISQNSNFPNEFKIPMLKRLGMMLLDSSETFGSLSLLMGLDAFIDHADHRVVQLEHHITQTRDSVLEIRAVFGEVNMSIRKQDSAFPANNVL
jgi:hypothetical protein